MICLQKKKKGLGCSMYDNIHKMTCQCVKIQYNHVPVQAITSQSEKTHQRVI